MSVTRATYIASEEDWTSVKHLCAHQASLLGLALVHGGPFTPEHSCKSHHIIIMSIIMFQHMLRVCFFQVLFCQAGLVLGIMVGTGDVQTLQIRHYNVIPDLSGPTHTPNTVYLTKHHDVS